MPATPSNPNPNGPPRSTLHSAPAQGGDPNPPEASVLILDMFGDGQGRSPLQIKSLKSLSTLMRDIEAARAEIARREKILAALDERLRGEVLPVERKLGEVRREALRVLGGHLKARWLKKRAARLLYESLCELADELEDDFGFDLEKERVELLGQEMMTEEEAKALEDVEDEMFSGMEEFFREFEKSQADEQAGGKPRRDGPDAGARRIHAPGDGKDSGKDDEIGAHGIDHGAAQSSQGRRQAKPGKSALKKREEENALAGDIRALYLLLARALHPDKEADPARRDAKTSWMKQVTTAYGERNLARLLDILAQNPLDAVGPYLSQAPVKTVQGFVKRLRRELATLRRQADAVFNQLPDHFRPILAPGGINEAWLKGHLGGLKKIIKFHKQRLESYRTREGCLKFVELLGRYEWRELL